MSMVTRRESLKLLLNGLAQTAGSLVLISAVLPGRQGSAKGTTAAGETGADLRQRADQVAAGEMDLSEDESSKLDEWVNGAFRNAAFRNTGGGGAGFRNAGFANGGGGGGFRNGGFVNGWRN
jgi:hypothetical protein